MKSDYILIFLIQVNRLMVKIKLIKIIALIFMLLSLVVPASIYAAVPGSNSSLQPSKPEVSILSTSSDRMELIVRFPAHPLVDSADGLVFNNTIYDHPSEVGLPDLPVLRENIEFPTGSDYIIEILDSRSYEGTLGSNGLPAGIPDRPAEMPKCEIDEACPDSNEIELDPIEKVEDTNEETNHGQDFKDDLEEENDPIEDPVENDLIDEQGESEEIDDENESEEPDQATPEDGDPEDELEEIEINTGDLFPASPVKLADTYVIRGHQIGLMEFWPVQYDAESQTVVIYEEIVVRVHIQPGQIRTASQRTAAYSSELFNTILSEEVINFDQGINTQSKYNPATEGIIIIAPDAFLNTMGPLVNLKQNQGHPVTLAGLSTTGTTPQEIKAYIQNAYTNWSQPPTYVLLVGDVNNGSNTMPAFTGASTGSVTDLYYGTVDGNDWIPDIFVGRLPARNTTQLNIMINNLVAYENLTGSEGWVKRAAFLASGDANFWHVAEGTQNYVIQNHTLPAGYSGTFPSNPQAGGDKLYAHTYSAGNVQVINAINNRRSLISYTGHGSRYSWGGPSFSQNNIRNINHTGTFSVVTSFACVTGDFSVNESFGETWLLQANKGAVTFIGSSANSYWGPDDILERRMMDSLYGSTETSNIVSYFLHAGLIAVHQARPGTGIAQSRYYWETYNLLGDPSLRMLLEAPAYKPQFNPSNLTSIQSPGQNKTIEVQLTNAGSQPDTYNLDMTSGSWVMNAKNGEAISLSPGQTTTFQIEVSIPPDATMGESEQVTLTATSQSDSSFQDTAIIELKTGMLHFIPLIIKP